MEKICLNKSYSHFPQQVIYKKPTLSTKKCFVKTCLNAIIPLRITKEDTKIGNEIMKTLKLKNKYQTNATLVSNDFIDHYMNHANGEFVKVYLFLLRHLNDPCSTLTISTIADCLDNTERDILRAFRYWESEGLLSMEKDADGKITCLSLEQVCTDTACLATKTLQSNVEPTAIPEEPSAGETSVSKAIPLDSFKAQKELKSLLFIAEQYLGKTLSKTDVDAITYFYDTLEMSADLIEYLIESCVENGHKSIHYIQKVALSWHDEGIHSKEEARLRSRTYNKSCYTVLNAFGIKNRGPADAELDFIRKWTDEFSFTLDIIQEACNRTIAATHQPSFEYADTILQKWKQAGVRTSKDISALDDAFQKEKAARKTTVPRSRTTATRNLNNFERRSYDMDSLEERLLNSN